MEKPGLWRNKKKMLRPDAARSARRLIRALTFCYIKASAEKTLFSLSAQFKNNRWM